MNADSRIPGTSTNGVAGEFVDLGGERFYAIRNVDRMPPFLVSVVSSGNHWLFASSNGGLAAGRVSPDTALFPYITVDKIHESSPHTGPLTLVRVEAQGQPRVWEPFNREQDGVFEVSRHLYKNVRGDKLCFEEINHELALSFSYTWLTSDDFGFVRRCEIRNIGRAECSLEVLDGLQNILPAGTPRFTQTNSSNLVDAYKWTELLDGSGLALYTLYAGITDRAEPCESLKASVAYCLGLDAPTTLISSAQVDRFRRGGKLRPENHTRGIRGAFLVAQAMSLPAGGSRQWHVVADVELGQAQVVALRHKLADPTAVAGAIEQSVRQGSDNLARLMAACDALQCTAEESVAVHHYANVVFNVLRGGCPPDQYRITSRRLPRHRPCIQQGRVRALAGTARVVARSARVPGSGRVGQARRRSAACPPLPGVPADRFRAPPRRPQPSVEPVRDQAQGPPGPARVLVRGQLAGHLPELGSARIQLPGIRREHDRQVRQCLDHGRLQPVSHHQGGDRLGGRGSGGPVEPHRVLGRPPDHLPAQVPRAVAGVPPGPSGGAAARTAVRLRQRALSHPAFHGPARRPEAHGRLRQRAGAADRSAGRRPRRRRQAGAERRWRGVPGHPAREAAGAAAHQARQPGSRMAASG